MQIGYRAHQPWGRREESCGELLHDGGAKTASNPGAASGEGEKWDVGSFCATAEPAASSSDVSSGSSDLICRANFVILCRWRTRRVWLSVVEMRTMDTWFPANTEGFYMDSARGCARWAEYHIIRMENVWGQQIRWPSKHLNLGLPFLIQNYNLEYWHPNRVKRILHTK